MTLAATVQFLVAATFVVIPLVGSRFGPGAQRAAEAEIQRQGHCVGVLKQHKIDFGASRASLVIAFGIAACFAVIGVFTLTGHETASWVVQPIMFVLGCVIMPGEVFTTRYVRAALPREVDAAALVRAAGSEFPLWTRYVIAARFALATAGSVLVCIILAT
ncbi:hypothetical protein JOF56_006647 [Kibdelosporangium banguiense]|uniref:DUF1772 domain-containing protein n=1 Tax=Kibdelosporangium banguiense TaxID=1365924 RepID=A0ABS4TPE0_9PSEU|nr:hypothetical protein [Kibdelosporangium banguiense]MBP2326262.1 hypothetical protein [Kibdelosporangium banguiense]